MSHIMVSRQYAVGKSRFIQHLIGRVGIFPLGNQRFIVYDISIVEEVLNVHPLPVGQDPVVDIQLILVKSVYILAGIALVVLVVVLGVALHHEGKVIIFPGSILFIICGAVRSFSRSVLGRRIALPVLDHDPDRIPVQMLCQLHHAGKAHGGSLQGLLRLHRIPGAGGKIVYVHKGLLAVGSTLPVYPDGAVFSRISADLHIKDLIGESVPGFL